MPGPETIGIIGFGRFGRLLSSILESDFALKVYDPVRESANQCDSSRIEFAELEKVLACEVIFYCVSVSAFEEALRAHIPIYNRIGGNKVLIDVLSVKMHPKLIFDKLLPANFEALLTHPIFGPDSVKDQGLTGQTIIVDQYRLSNDNFIFWKKYFTDKHFHVLEMSAQEHDLLAAKSQGVTHIIGRLLSEIGFQQTAIDTLNSKRLYEIMRQVCNDKWQLFVDLQTFNPYCQDVRMQLAVGLDKLLQQLNSISPANGADAPSSEDSLV